MYNREINRLVKHLNPFIAESSSEEKAFARKMLLVIGEAIKKENPKSELKNLSIGYSVNNLRAVSSVVRAGHS